MKTRLAAVAGAALLVLALSPAGVAATNPPAAVDCDVLGATLVAIDDVIDFSSGGTVGELLSAFQTNPVTFNSFNNLIFIFSGGTISFASGAELVSTLGTCELVPLLVSLVNG